jgi:hypothetical protein
MKDFLFFNYSWVPNSTFIFKSFEKLGYSCDFVDEANLVTFVPKDKYRAVFLYLHEGWTIPITNYLINNYFQDSVLIQHDDTDFEDIQHWSDRKPDIVMHREYTDQTKNPRDCVVYPMHFPIPSRFNSQLNHKDIDICFIGGMTNARRAPFIDKIVNLASGSMNDLRWYISTAPQPPGGQPSIEYIEAINRSKIGLHYFGNSYDSWRIWELASTKTAIVMPQMRNKSVSDSAMPFKDYCVIRDDFQDVEEKLRYMLDEKRYEVLAQKSFDDYNINHIPEKCFEYYFNAIKKHVDL